MRLRKRKKNKRNEKKLKKKNLKKMMEVNYLVCLGKKTKPNAISVGFARALKSSHSASI